MERIVFNVPTFHIESLREHCVVVKPKMSAKIKATDISKATKVANGALLEVVYLAKYPDLDWGYIERTYWEAYTITTAEGDTFALYAEDDVHADLQLQFIQTGIVENDSEDPEGLEDLEEPEEPEGLEDLEEPEDPDPENPKEPEGHDKESDDLKDDDEDVVE